MRLAFALLPLVLPALVAQDPVDYAALQKEVDAATDAIKAAKVGKKDEKTYEAVAGKALAALRARGKDAQGERKEATLVAEFVVLARAGSLSEAFKERVLREVPAASPAWKLESQIAPHLPRLLGKEKPEVKAYCAEMAAKGTPEVRSLLLADGLGDLLADGKLEEAKGLVERLQREFPGQEATKEAAETLASELKTVLGQPAPVFSIPSLENPKVTFTNATFKGKYLLMDFWGTWCGWCVKELPHVHKLYATYKGRGLEILSLAAESKAETVMAFRKKPTFPMPWKHALLGSGNSANPVQDAFGVTGFPSVFLLGPDGRLLAKGEDLRGENLEKTLAKHLGR